MSVFTSRPECFSLEWSALFACQAKNTRKRKEEKSWRLFTTIWVRSPCRSKATEILALYESMKHKLADLTRSQYAIHALDWIFDRPIFTSPDFAAHSAIPEPTAKRILPALRDAGVLRTLVEGRGRRAATLCFPALLNIAEGHEVF